MPHYKTFIPIMPISKAQIKRLKALHQAKFRLSDRLFLVEGKKGVEEALASDWEVQSVYSTDENWVQTHTGAECITTLEMQQISALNSPSEHLACIALKTFGRPDGKENVLYLDGIRDPGNLGTIIRTCDWFGINQIVCSLDTVDNYNPKVIQSAMGSILHVEVIYRSLPTFLSTVQDIPIYAAVLNGKSIHDIAIAKPSLLLIGNESNGISKEVLSFATEKITIPKLGQAESLNAAIASGIIISALLK